MRRPLGTLLPALLLTGLLGGLATACGDDSGGVGDDAGPAPTASSPAGRPTGADGAVDFELVTTLTETAAGGDVSPDAVPLGDDAAVQEFVAPFSEALQTEVQQAVASTSVPDDQRLYGAVVALGCDAPDQVQVVASPSGLQVVAEKVPAPKPECLAPMTTVALVLVPASAVG
jgi:hypothetical protein